jgi:hypothetical protein
MKRYVGALAVPVLALGVVVASPLVAGAAELCSKNTSTGKVNGHVCSTGTGGSPQSLTLRYHAHFDVVSAHDQSDRHITYRVQYMLCSAAGCGGWYNLDSGTADIFGNGAAELYGSGKPFDNCSGIADPDQARLRMNFTYGDNTYTPWVKTDYFDIPNCPDI